MPLHAFHVISKYLSNRQKDRRTDGQTEIQRDREQRDREQRKQKDRPNPSANDLLLDSGGDSSQAPPSEYTDAE